MGANLYIWVIMLRLWVSLLFVFLSSLGFSASPSILYLTWIHDPATTMTIQWHTGRNEKETGVAFRKAGDSEWLTREGGCGRLQKTDYLVHTVELDGLLSGTDYEFEIQGKKGTYKFRTMPKNS